MGSNRVLIIAVAALVVLAAGAYWYFMPPAPSPSVGQDGGSITSPQDADLGSSLYEKSSNPVQDKLPGSVAPVTNPIEDIYKNPFQ